MNSKSTVALALFMLLLPVAIAAGEPVYPLRVSPNGRHFVDQNGEPTFWLGTTHWQLCRDNTLADANATLVGSKQHGFNVVQVMLLGIGDGTQPNVNGDNPWTSLDPLSPNEAYFKHVDAVIQSSREHNIVIALMPYHQRWRQVITEQNARGFAKWLGERYRDVPTVLWSLCPEQKPEYIPVLRELAAGLRAGDAGKHLITVHPDPSPCTSSFVHHEPWLDFNCIQVWKSLELISPMVTKDYALQPTKPVVMAEGVYEAGLQYGFEITTIMLRREAYYSYLLGGHYSYGHYDGYHMLPTWKEALDAPGAKQMEILKQVFLDRQEWWNLVPDQLLFADGGKTVGTVLNLAARHQDGRWGLVYLADKSSFAIDMSKFAGAQTVTVSWIDPRTGESVSIGKFPVGGVKEFTTPDGWEDSLLLLEAPGAR